MEYDVIKFKLQKKFQIQIFFFSSLPFPLDASFLQGQIQRSDEVPFQNNTVTWLQKIQKKDSECIFKYKEKVREMCKGKAQQKFQQLLQQFLRRHASTEEQMNRLCYMLLTTKEKLQCFYSQFQQKMDVFTSLKMLMLVHYAINYSVRLDEEIVGLLGRVDCVDKADGFLKELLVHKYRNYLQKRLYRQWEATYPIQPDENDAVNQVYRCLNLLESGLVFVGELYTLGRYYLRKYEWVMDFVKGLATDFSKIYHCIETKLKQVSPLHSQFDVLLTEIERINQKLENVYLNRYFAGEVMKLRPKLLNKLNHPHRQQIKTSPQTSPNKQDESTILPEPPQRKTIILQCLGQGFAYRQILEQNE